MLDFYEGERAKLLFKHGLCHLATRASSLTGIRCGRRCRRRQRRALARPALQFSAATTVHTRPWLRCRYRDNPAIFSWDLINEPR